MNDIMFPVTVPYVTTPHMQRWSGPLLTPVRPAVLKHKQQQLALRESDLVANRRPDLVRRAAEILGVPLTDCVKTLALGINEDFAVLHQGQLVSICFCFPSGWVPAHKVGQTLSQIHQPVADGSVLQRMSAKIAQIMAQQSMFRRGVWTVTTTANLSNHPAVPRPQATEQTALEDLWFRTETQTTFALGDGESSGFLVLVECHPLNVIWQDQDRRATLMASLDSMTDAVLDYKQLRSIRARLRQLNMT